MADEKKLLNSVQAAQYLNLRPQTLANWRFERRKLNYIKVGRSIKYEISELDRFIAENRIVVDA